MPVVTNTVLLPDGSGAQYATVVIRLVANATVGTEAPGYVGTSEILGTFVPAVSSAGVWSLTLTANSLITPSGTVYQITTQIPGRPVVVEYVSVPNGAGPYSVANILTSAPSSITPTELAAHLADTVDAHDASAVSMTAVAGLSTTDTVQAALGYLSNVYNVKAYGAVGDGATDDTTAIQAAIDAATTVGGVVEFPAASFVVAGLILKSNVWLRGKGVRATTLLLKPSSTADVVVGANFATLTGGNTNGGISGWAITDLTINGNKANAASGGWGLRVYGYGYTLRSVAIRNCKTGGLWSEWSTNATVTGATLEAFVSDVAVEQSDGSGVEWAGPHDSQWVNCTVNRNVGKGFWVKPSGGAILTAQGVHVWGSTHTHAWYLEGQSILEGCQGEGASTAQVLIGANDCSVNGGKYFAAGAAAPVGFLIGDATHTNPTGVLIDTRINDCTSGALVFTNGGSSNGVVRVVNYQASGSVVVGSVSSSMNLQVTAITTAQADPFRFPGALSVRTTASQAFDVIGANNKFSINSSSGRVSLNNGALLSFYTGNFTGGPADIRSGTGSPESVVTAPPGSLFLRTDGAASTTLYVKESGTGSTGWRAV